MGNVETGVCIPKDFGLNYIHVNKLTPIVIKKIKEFCKKYVNEEFKHKYLQTSVLFTNHNSLYNFEISSDEYLVIGFKKYGFDIHVYNQIEFDEMFDVIKEY